MTKTNKQQALSRELALRIGLAAKVLPDVDARELLTVLVDRVGTPLTDKKLREITVKNLRTAMISEDGEGDTEDSSIDNEVMKEAVHYLWGDGVKDPSLPDLYAFEEGDMPGSVRVAVATTGGNIVDGHFGSCPYFYIYQVDQNETRLIAVRSTVGADDAEDKNAFRAALINDCQVMYVQSIGGPAAAKVVRANVHPIKIPKSGDVKETITKLQATLAGTPPPWLAKAMGVAPEDRVRFQQEDEE